MGRPRKSFRIGRVTVYQRGAVWYLCYHENGVRRRPRIGPDFRAARQAAAETVARLESGARTPYSFEPISIADLRSRWLNYHENVLSSSVATVQRYRTASAHLIRFVDSVHSGMAAARFEASHAEDFSAHLRKIKVAPNGHPNAHRRSLRDKGVKYILEVCRSLFNYAARRRHLPPYSENPFTAIRIDRMPVGDSATFVGLDDAQERALLEACTPWEFPIFLTLFLTGVRPGELTHLLVEDVDVSEGWLRIRNKPDLGWSVKTRNERSIPLVSELAQVLRAVLKGRTTGPVFLRPRFLDGDSPALSGLLQTELRDELRRRNELPRAATGNLSSREEELRITRRLWAEMGALKTDAVRSAFMRLTARIGLPQVTAPKTLRHMFATALQDANVDPLIRSQLMGHARAGESGGALGMTGVYTHTRADTLRRQLEEALRRRPAVACAWRWLERSSPDLRPKGACLDNRV